VIDVKSVIAIRRVAKDAKAAKEGIQRIAKDAKAAKVTIIRTKPEGREGTAKGGIQESPAVISTV
jgi:hypothetical protein